MEEENKFFLAYRSWKTKRSLARRPRRIILVRHGESVANLDATVYARVPDNKIELSPRGVEQAAEAGRRLRALVGDESVAFFISPYLRSRQTLDAVLRSSGIACPVIREDPRLREQEWGNFQDPAVMPEAMRKRREVGSFFYRFAEGESGADVFDRISSFNETLFRDFKRKDCTRNVVLVSHGIALRLFLTRYFRWPIEVFHDLWNLDNCEMVVLERQEMSKLFCLTTPLKSNRSLYRDWVPQAGRILRHQSIIPEATLAVLSQTMSVLGTQFEFPPQSLPLSSSSSSLGEPPPSKRQNKGSTGDPATDITIDEAEKASTQQTV
jgi:broad specificity phosphatase PhoE